ncbi:MAG: hypothetical protein HWE30_14430 [Methylocystaceae bacterium]|nr:hypothetical protein [Methylocystaceae bacterium]
MFNFLDDVASSVGNFFSVEDSYTPDTPISSPDAVKTGGALSNLGYFGANGESEFSLPNSVKAFQDANGLKVDGVINKGGPTEKAISGALEQQSLSTTNPLESINDSTPSYVTVSKPISSNPDQKSFTASASFGPKPKSVPKPKIDPMTGVADPLANAPKPNKSMKKAWDEYYKTQEQKAQKAIVPKGNTTQQAIMSLMQDPRYTDKNDTRLRDHVVKQFERAFPGQVQYDETGKMIQPTAVIAPEQVESFDPDGELTALSQKSKPEISETFIPTVPLAEAGPEQQEAQPLRQSNDDASLVQAFKDEWQKAKKYGVKRYVGPHGEQALKDTGEVLQKLANFFGPQADMIGATEESAKVTHAVKNGDYGAALAHLGMTGAELADILTPGNMTALAGMVKFKDGDMFDASDFEEFFRKHLEGGDKGDRIPNVTFDFGPLEQRLFDQYKEFNPRVADVENRLRMPAGSMAHWDAARRKGLEPMVGDLHKIVPNTDRIVQGGHVGRGNEGLLVNSSPKVKVPISDILEKTPGTLGVKSIIAPLDNTAYRRALKKGK